MHKKIAIETIDFKLYHQLFPEELLTYFEITQVEHLGNIEIKEEFLIIEFTEKNILPEEYSSQDYESKGFIESKLIQDFPLRGKAVFLRIKRRRWRHKKTSTIVKRDFTFIAAGSKFTNELSDFLKEASGYAHRYHEQHSQLLRD